ncbi:MAG: PAS/PAC sensor signal transduction histidine kinase [Candidatus Magasanikbacteria bacterium GW2011_GWA2_37_8]|uniref:histidine kinase n=1 Tax=Candidatus Magasanikbacteria bacterium GW2011_GWA2_37_8 TaxID=1619036 RepID=A0A0G0KJY1_9BACT|nr:MAG: PAS/PAC sensor signal transduction histidine kinase [Candidatus Magasanikbacteria bacterium GW2011_GWA2_37_8]
MSIKNKVINIVELTDKEKIILFSSIVKQSAEGMAVADLTGKLTFVNKAWYKMHGYKSSDNLIGQNLNIFHNKKQIKDEVKLFNKKVIKFGTYSGEVGHITKDGKPFLTIMTTTLLKNSKGKPYAIIGTAKDITEKKENEEKLKEKEARYRGLFETSRDAVMTLDPPLWKFTSGNKATLEMFKVKNEAEFLSYPPWKLSPKLQPDGQLSSKKAKEMIELAIKNGSNLFGWVHRRKDGEDFFAEVFLSKVETSKKVFLQAIVRDITKQKLSEEKIINKTADLVRLNKAMVGREKKMIELKKEIEELKKQLKYD